MSNAPALAALLVDADPGQLAEVGPFCEERNLSMRMRFSDGAWRCFMIGPSSSHVGVHKSWIGAVVLGMRAARSGSPILDGARLWKA